MSGVFYFYKVQKNFNVYKSSAGSGKTYTLVKEYLKIALADNSDIPKSYRKILAVTFTNKAAAEMKLRVIDALKNISSANTKTESLAKDLCDVLKIAHDILVKRATKLLSEILHNYSDFAISTIDSFTHKIVKTFAYDLKLPVNFTIETNTNEFYRKVVSALLAKIGELPELTDLLIQYSSNNAQDNVAWDPELKLIEFSDLIQKENAQANLSKLKNYSKEELKNIQVKLRAFISDFKNSINKAGEESLRLIKSKHLTEANFSYGKTGAISSLRKWAEFSKDKTEDLIGKRLEEVLIKNSWASNKNSADENNALNEITPKLNSLASSTISFINDQKEQYNLFILLEKNIYALILLNELQEISEEMKSEEQIVFISEFNSKISEIVANEPSPFIYERLGERYNNFLLDEFQDTSTLQWMNLLPLIDNSLSAGNFNLIVGDGKQSIYRWRNANVLQFNSLPKVNNPANNPIISERENSLTRNYDGKVLDTNYRSLKEIVEFNYSIFGYLPGKLLSDEFKSIYDSQHQKTKHTEGGYVSIRHGDVLKEGMEELNFRYINEEIVQALASGFEYKDICIIVRNNKNGNVIANYLIENNIPVISSDSLLLKNNPAVNCLISFLKYLNNPFDNISAASVLTYISSKKTNFPDLLNKLHFEKNLFSVLKQLTVNLSAASFIQKNVFDSCVEIITKLELEKQHPQYIRFFLDEVNDYLVNKSGSVNDFLEWWDKRKEQASLIIPDGTNAVKVMTIHKSKGLEFPIVILPFVNWGVYKADNSWVDLENTKSDLPVSVLKISSGIAKAGLGEIFELEKNEQFLDNMNLLYVAFTRAAERLHIISLKTSRQNTDSIATWISDFIKDKNLTDYSGLVEFGKRSGKILNHDSLLPETTDISQIHFNTDNSNIKIKGSHKLKVTDDINSALEKGIKIHYILSEINSKEDIEKVLSEMEKTGVIQANEKEDLQEKIFSILGNTLIKEYFTQFVISKNEAEIITENGEILRPDKIIIIGKDAVVIDYKTGQPDSKKHSQQMQKYNEALLKMGYTAIKKFLVYIDLNMVEELK